MHKQNIHDISTIWAIFTVIASAKQNDRASIHLSEIPMKYPSTKNNAQSRYTEKYKTHWDHWWRNCQTHIIRTQWVYNIPSLVQAMARRRPGDKPLSGPMLVMLPTHICVTRPQWVLRWKIIIWVWFNSSPPGQKSHHLADDNFRRIFADEKICI